MSVAHQQLPRISLYRISAGGPRKFLVPSGSNRFSDSNSKILRQFMTIHNQSINKNGLEDVRKGLKSQSSTGQIPKPGIWYLVINVND